MINLYTNSTIGSYTTGKVTCTKNSANVTGSGTTWSEIVNPGDILTLNDDKLYVIKTVNSNTSITLDKVFAENTVSNSAYRIFLNTAAHFPSDTAAKVERALEQLSDINEAAINNDRTVTAATKVNGKGLTNTTGDINIYPNSVNANNGGRIQFHYNQESTETAKIWESASGQVRIDGNLYLNGKFKNYVNREIGFTRGVTTDTASTDYPMITHTDVNNKNVGRIINTLGYVNSTNYKNTLGMFVYNPIDASINGSVASIYVGYNQNGAYTYAPTPALDSADNNIATTAFVNSRIKSVKELGSNYVMNASDFGTTAGYYRCSSLDTSDDKNFICGNFGGSADVGDYRFLVEGMSAAYKNILAFTPRSYEFFYGRFWSSEWQGWRVVPTVEEGTWTPKIYGSNTAGAFNYTTQTGAYVKIGRLVYIRGYLAGTCTTEPLGQARLNGLPYAPTEACGTSGYSAATGGSDYSMKRIVNLFIGTSYLTVRIQNKSDNTIDYASFSNTSSDGYNIKMLVNDSITLQFSCVYVTNTR